MRVVCGKRLRAVILCSRLSALYNTFACLYPRSASAQLTICQMQSQLKEVPWELKRIRKGAKTFCDEKSAQAKE